MMKIRRLLTLIICILCILLSGSLTALADEKKDTVGETKDIIDGILSFNTQNYDSDDVQNFIDDKRTAGIGGTAEWYVLGLSQYGSYDFGKYKTALETYVKEKDIKGATSRLKFAFLLLAVNGDKSFVEKCLSDDTVGGQGIMSYVYGLHLINNRYEGIVKKDFIIEQLSEYRHEDKGWSVTGEYGDVDVTAMVIQALAPLYNESTDDISKSESELTEIVKELVEDGIEFLSERQLPDGDFKSFGVRNAESVAQVITALSALHIDPDTDERFIKNGNSVIDGLLLYRNEDGSFSHKQGEETNPTATVQVFYSMVAYNRMLKGRDSLFVLDALRSENADSTPENSEKTDIENNNETVFEENKADSEEKTGIISEKKETSCSGYKSYVIFGIIGVALAACIILALLKKHYKNFIFVGLLTLAGILFTLFTDFSSPESYYSESEKKENVCGTVTMSIRCDILTGISDDGHIPEDGCILDTAEFEISDGDSVYDILLESAKKYGISVEHEGSSDMAYISGINYLYEQEYGDLSGWVYKVNGEMPSVGCAGYKLKDKDKIEWCYTLDLGNDAMK